jgi:hypothetical protein
MDKHFEEFMNKLQQDPEGAAAFKEMKDMMGSLFGGMGGMGMGGMPGMPTGAGEEDDKKLDSMTDMLLEQFLDKDILMEPLQSAKSELSVNVTKPDIEAADKEKMQAQLNIIDQLIETFEKEPENKKKLIALFEEMNKVGSFFDLIAKYNPDHAGKQGLGGLGGLESMFGGGPENPLGKGDNPECTLI